MGDDQVLSNEDEQGAAVLMNEPEENPAEDTAESEEAPAVETPVRANRRETRRQTAHVPGPRQKPNLDPAVTQWDAEAETGGEAPAEPEVSNEGVVKSSKYEDPITLGSVDG